MRHITLIIAVLALALAAPAFSGKGGYPVETAGTGTAETDPVMETGTSQPRVAHVPSTATCQRHRTPELDTDELHGHRLVRYDRLGYRLDGRRHAIDRRSGSLRPDDV